MNTSPAGRKVLAEREGRRLKAYRDSVGVWTIGIGHTSAAGAPKVTPGLVITEAECDAIFARDLVAYEMAVNEAVKVPLRQHEFDALVSLCYNIGQAGFARSTVVRRLNAGDRAGAAEAFLLWNKPAAILGRRRGERAQFLGQTYAARLGPDEQAKASSTSPQPSRKPKAVPQPTSPASQGRHLLAAQQTPIAPLRTETPDMLNPTLPLAVFDLIKRAVEAAAERPEVDIPADRKKVIAAQVAREAGKLPEMQELEKATAPKSKWQSKGMIGALVAGVAGVAGALGFVLAPEEIDAVVGLVSNGIVVAGAILAWIGRKNATQPIA
jgi:lysozyme